MLFLLLLGGGLYPDALAGGVTPTAAAAATADPDPEVGALCSLFLALGGYNASHTSAMPGANLCTGWSQSYGWCETCVPSGGRDPVPKCSWNGVVCDVAIGGESPVTGIALANFEIGRAPTVRLDALTFDGPNAMHNLPALASLDLSGNDIQGTIPQELFTRTNITHIMLASNFLTGYLPTFYAEVLSANATQRTRNVTWMDFSNNKLGESGSHLPSLEAQFFASSLTWGLETVVLRDMDLSSSIPDTLHYLSHLVHLDISSNNLLGHIPNDLFANMPFLKTLLFNENEVTGGLPSSLSLATSLEEIDGSNNLISDADTISALRGLTNLKRFDFSYNNLAGHLTDDISPKGHGLVLPNLVVLDLTGNSISGSLPAPTFAPNIEHLSLGSNAFGGVIVPEMFSMHTHLKQLWLNDNMLCGEIPSTFHSLLQLESVFLQDNVLIGTVDPFWMNLTLLASLSLDGNNLAGYIPDALEDRCDSDEHGIICNIDSPQGLCKKEDREHLMRILGTEKNAKRLLPRPHLTLENSDPCRNWDGNDFSQWIGIVCSGEGYITKIDLPDYNLSAAMPEGQALTLPSDTFAKMVMLEHVDLRGNGYSGAVPLLGDREEWESPMNYLDLRNNSFDFIPWRDNEIPDWKLDNLQLTDNKLSGTISRAIGEWFAQFDIIDLEGNDFWCGDASNNSASQYNFPRARNRWPTDLSVKCGFPCSAGSWGPSGLAPEGAAGCYPCRNGTTTPLGVAGATSQANCSVCNPGFFGPTCESCACSNVGTLVCNDGGEGDGKCVCKQSYSGAACETCIAHVVGESCSTCEANYAPPPGPNEPAPCKCIYTYSHGIFCCQSLWPFIIGVGAALCVCITLPFAVFIAIRVFSKWKRRRVEMMLLEDLQMGDPLLYSMPTRNRAASAGRRRSSLSTLEETGNLVPAIAYKDIRIIREIGRGSFGKVSVGLWKGHTEVAVKEFYELPSESMMEDNFMRELQAHARLRHPNVLQIIGACVEPFACITEFVRRGSLLNFLLDTSKVAVSGRLSDMDAAAAGVLNSRKARTLSDEELNRPRAPTIGTQWENLGKRDGRLLPWNMVVSFARDAARGLAYLHDRGVVHRDVKPGNFLVAADWTLKVCDFGMARSTASTMTAGIGTVLWCAPEVFAANGHYTEACDVFSFGLVLYSIVSRCRNPYAELLQGAEGNAWAVLALVREGQRPLLPETPRSSIEAGLGLIIRRCWNEDPAQRPRSFSCLARAIDVVIACALDPMSSGRQDSTGSRGSSNALAGMTPKNSKALRDLVRRTCAPAMELSAMDGVVAADVLCIAVEHLLATEGDIGEVLEAAAAVRDDS